LLSAPTPPPFWASYDLNPRHRTVPNTSANTITCTGAYQPDPPQLGKAAITAGIRFSDILFQNDSGEVVLWALNGTNVIGGGSLGNPGARLARQGVRRYQRRRPCRHPVSEQQRGSRDLGS
jgi:hypothetical protein